MGLLQEVTNEQAAAKVAMFGGTGSGKTTTAALALIGISKHFCNSRPVAMVDTENGSDYLKPLFDAEGIKLVRVKSRSFKSLLQAHEEARAMGCCGMLADSMTHIWRELGEAYLAKINESRRKVDSKARLFHRLELYHMDPIKREWNRWTEMMMNSPLHIFVLGRLGYEWEFQENDQGKRELVKGDTKMKAEGEFGYEPNLVIEMEKEHVGDINHHHALVLKDRTWALNGKRLTFEGTSGYRAGGYEVVYEALLPHFRFLNLEGKQAALDTSLHSRDMFDANGHGDGERIGREKKIATETVQAILTTLFPGQDSDSKRAKVSIIHNVFGTRSWTAVEGLRLDKLQQGVRALELFEERVRGAMPDSEEELLAALDQAIKEAEADLAAKAQVKAIKVSPPRIGTEDNPKTMAEWITRCMCCGNDGKSGDVLEVQPLTAEGLQRVVCHSCGTNDWYINTAGAAMRLARRLKAEHEAQARQVEQIPVTPAPMEPLADILADAAIDLGIPPAVQPREPRKEAQEEQPLTSGAH